MIIFGAIYPHPPILVPQVGGKKIKEAEQTEKALKNISKKIKSREKDIDLIVVVTPHGVFSQVSIPVYTNHVFEGSFLAFGAPKPKYKFKGDTKFAINLIKDAGLLAQRSPETTIDHGALVPLHYLSEAGVNRPILLIGISDQPLQKLFDFGKILSATAERLGKRIVVIASADLSHRLTDNSPEAFDPAGEEFDRKLVELVKHLDVPGILNFPKDLADRAGQDALWSIAILMGALEGYKFSSDVLSYEAPFGVGYMATIFETTKYAQKNVVVSDPLVELAKKAIETYVNEKKVIPTPLDLTPEMNERAGVFVSLKKHGQLRGCIGTFSPNTPNVAEEIINNAIESATADLRFSPVKRDELKDLTISVDVLTAPEKVRSIEELDAKEYGVIVKSGNRRGLLLPDLEGVDTPEDQIKICRQKAGIGEEDPIELSRFRVRRHK